VLTVVGDQVCNADALDLLTRSSILDRSFKLVSESAVRTHILAEKWPLKMHRHPDLIAQ